MRRTISRVTEVSDPALRDIQRFLWQARAVNIKDTLKRAIPAKMPDVPLMGASDSRWSVISSAADLYSERNDGLVEIAISAAAVALADDLSELQARCGEPDATWIKTWPGEHYRLLAALVKTLDAKVIVEIGTFKGQGALALAQGSDQAVVITYDILSWDTFADTAFTIDDFAPIGRIEQRIGDLGQQAYLVSQLETLQSADLIFVDGPKDGIWEQSAVPAILSALSDRRRLVVFDDIRLLEMVQLWRDLDNPKLDVTSLGHWSGTGFVWTT